MKRIVLYGLLLLALAPMGLRANNIQVTNVKIVDRTDSTAYIKFTVGWDNSWKDRAHGNWDAAWVFAKAYHNGDKKWIQVYFAAPEGMQTNANGDMDCYIQAPHCIKGAPSSPVWVEFGTSMTEYGEQYSGVFIYRKNIGHGSFLVEDVCLRWNYGEDQYNLRPEDNLHVSVFAIEMVYVPSHAYILGDGSSTNSLYFVESSKTVKIRTDVVGYKSFGMGTVRDVEEKGFTYLDPSGATHAIPDTFPKGMKPYYVMKHEISQHAYADFLNTLTLSQQEVRTYMSLKQLVAAGSICAFAMIPPASTPGCRNFTSNPAQYRNFIRMRTVGYEGTLGDPTDPPVAAKFGHNVSGKNTDDSWDMETNAGNVACNFLSWSDGLAYLDWSCLRPMSELEFEKACRGNKFLREDMAWGERYGVALIKYQNRWFDEENQSNERAAYEEATYLPTGQEPWVMRVGAFAKDSTYRKEAGATYYGVLNMSDNLWERCVNVSTEAGRKFIPNEGDGVLGDGRNGDNGEAFVMPDNFSDESCWPTEAGAGYRGGKVSDRTYAESTRVATCESNQEPRTQYSGFRGCRYAPRTSTATLFSLP